MKVNNTLGFGNISLASNNYIEPLLGNPLQGNPLTSTKQLHSYFVMLFLAFTAAPFGCYLFRGSFHFSLLQEVKCMLNWVKAWWLNWLKWSQTFHFLSLIKFSVVLAVCFESLSCCMMKFLPISLDVFFHKQNVFCRLLNSSCCYHHNQ